MIDLSLSELCFRQPVGVEVDGFVVGHLAKMNGNANTAVIVGLDHRNGRLRVTLQFPNPQSVDVPDSATSTTFELDFASVSCHWRPTAIQAFERPGALKDSPPARRAWRDAATATVNGWHVVTAEVHRVSLLKGNDLVFFAHPDANFDNPVVLANHDYQLALAEARRWAQANDSLTQAA